MKKLVFVIISLFYSVSFSQTILTPLALPVEIYPIAKSTSNPTGSTTFTMEAVSQVWGGDNEPGTNDYENLYTWLSNDYNFLTYEALNDNEMDSGWDWVLSNTLNDGTYSYGKYKFIVDLGNSEKYFYLDYRDDRCGFYPPLETTGHPIDLWIKYNHDLNKFEINSYGGHPANPNWADVSDGSTIKIWEIKGMGSPSTGKFEPYAPENLTVTTVSGKPKLTWQHHSPADDYWVGYKVYRCISSSYPPTNFTKIADISKYTLNYTDNSLVLRNQEVAYYKIKAENSNALSQFSNQVQFGVPSPPTAPQNLQVTTFRNHPILTWTANPESDIAEYVIYIRENSGNWWERGRISYRYTSYTDLLTNTSTPYDFLEYHIKAKNTNNLYSDMSNIVSVMGITEKRVAETDTTQNDKKISEYSISNFPNPFNPTTQISYQIPKDGLVNLIVYNSLGQEIAKLVNQHQSSGKYSVQFNATNLPSGVYIYKIQVGEFTSTKKMLLTK